MKQVKILAIGNSFSEEATHYLHQIAKADAKLYLHIWKIFIDSNLV